MRKASLMGWLRSSIAAILVTAVATRTVEAAEVSRNRTAADDLCRLLPSDAAAALVVENWGERSRSFFKSKLYQDMSKLSAAADWRESAANRHWRSFLDRTETIFGMPAGRVRDEFFGESAALALHLPADAPLDAARGLLLSRVRDLKSAEKLLDKLNAAEREEGKLVEVADRRQSGLSYRVRVFAPGVKPTEFYALLADRTLVWSNSEDLVRGVLDRSAALSDQARNPRPLGLGDQAGFQALRAALPDSPLVSFHLNPRVWEKRLELSGPGDESLALIRRVLHSLDGFALALENRDGPVLHLRATLRPIPRDHPFARLLRADAHADAERMASPSRVPADAIGFAVARIDLVTLFDLGRAATAWDRHPSLPLLQTFAEGIMLGKNPRRDILPNVGPFWLSYLRDAGERPLEVVSATSLADDPAVSAALENASKTLLALVGLSANDRRAKSRKESLSHSFIETSRIGDTVLTSLSEPSLAFAIDRRHFAIGSSQAALQTWLKSRTDEAAWDVRRRLISTYFPDSGIYAIADLDRLRAAIAPRRERLARLLSSAGDDPAATSRDLDRVLESLSLFRFGFLSLACEPESASIHIRIGLVNP